MLYVFGDYTLDAEQYELRQAGRRVPLEPRVVELLAYLVQHPGRTVPTEELLTQLYPNEFAPAERLTNAVAQARTVLGDTGQRQLWFRGFLAVAILEVGCIYSTNGTPTSHGRTCLRNPTPPR